MTEQGNTDSCSRCHDLGYVTRPGSRWAEAEVCRECSVPCPRCGGEGRLVDRDERGRVWVTACQCAGLHRRVQLFNGAHLPAAYHNKTVEGFQAATKDQATVKSRMLAFQDRGGAGDRGVLVVGAPGIGKTHLVCGILRFLILERGLTCRYVDSFQLLQELKATFEVGEGASALMESVSSVPVLGVDELGKTKPTGWQHEVLDQIISRRYDQGLTTFVTSNYGLRRRGQKPDSTNIGDLVRRETLEERVGPRIYSRLMEMTRPLVLTGKDRRLTEAG